MSKQSSVESEFATAEEFEAHDRWFRTRVRASLADPSPTVPHDQVMAEIEAIIAEAEQRRSGQT
ncbi:MAG: antitoxin [Acetobacteraceae bacterium]